MKTYNLDPKTIQSIYCIGRNYKDHIKELKNETPTKPLVFLKSKGSLSFGDNVDFLNLSDDIQQELEIVLQIGKNLKVERLGLGIDFTARDLQDDIKKKGHPWTLAKSQKGFCYLGKFLEVSQIDINNLNLKLYKNDKLQQEGESKDMIFSFDYIINYISGFCNLLEGDIIFTGTPSGVSRLESGDKLEGHLNDYKLIELVVSM